MNRIALSLFFLVMLVPLLLYADKSVTQKTVVLAHVDRLNIDNVGGALSMAVTYHVVDSAGGQIGHMRSLSIALSGGQITTLTNFITTTVIPAINTAEGT